MTFTNFIIEQEVIGVIIGTIIGFSITNFIKDFKYLIIKPLFMKFKITKNKSGIISSIIELLIVFLLLYFIYTYLIKPLFKKELDENKEKEKNLQKWRKQILDEIKDIDYGNVYI